jgi:hypothetical protein
MVVERPVHGKEMNLGPMNSRQTLPTTLHGGERYDGTTIALHWLTAVLVLALWGIAQAESLVPRAERHLLWPVHVGFCARVSGRMH